MKDMIKHKGYFGSVHYNPEDRVFYGKVEFIRSLRRTRQMRRRGSEFISGFLLLYRESQ